MDEAAFVRENRDAVRALSGNLAALQSEAEPGAIDAAFRAAHTLKGNFRMAGFETAGELAHAIEDVLDAVRSEEIDPRSDVVDEALTGADDLGAMLDEIERAGNPTTDPTERIETMRSLLAAGGDRNEGDDPRTPGLNDGTTGRTAVPGETDAESGSHDNTASTSGGEAAPTVEDAVDAEVAPDLDDEAQAALDAASEFDDLDDLVDDMDDEADEFADLEGGGAFDGEVIDEEDPGATGETVAEVETAADSGANADPVTGDDATTEQRQPQDATSTFAELKDDVDEAGDVDELDAELQEVDFGEFDEDDDVSIQQLIEAEPADTDLDPTMPGADAANPFVFGDDREGTADLTSNPDSTDASADSGPTASRTNEASAVGPTDEAEAGAAAPGVETDSGGDGTDADTPTTADATSTADTSDAGTTDQATAAETESESESEPAVDGFDIDPDELAASADETTSDPAAAGTADVESVLSGAQSADEPIDREKRPEDARDGPVGEGETGSDVDTQTATERAEPGTPTAPDVDDDVDQDSDSDRDFDLDLDLDRESEPSRPGEEPTTAPSGDTRKARTDATADAGDTGDAREALADVLSVMESDAGADATTSQSRPPEGDGDAQATVAETEASTETVPDTDEGVTPDPTTTTDTESTADTSASAGASTSTDTGTSTKPSETETPTPDEGDVGSDLEAVGQTRPDRFLDDDGNLNVEGAIGDRVDESEASRVESDVDLDVESRFGRDEATAAFESQFGQAFAGEDDDEAVDVVSTIEASQLDGEPFEYARVEDFDPGTVAAGETIPVPATAAERLLSLVEQLSTTHLRLRTGVHSDDVTATESALADLGAVADDLRSQVMDIRLVPLSTATGRLPRVARNVARETDKRVEFDTIGTDVQLDRSIINRVSDPLVHLVRNAVDHGIEPPEERERRGKPRQGSVTVRAEQVRDRVEIEVIDDGGGIDADAIRELAIERGVITADEARQLSDSAARDLVFEPGFTTAEEVTEVSGRGVGMDVVTRVVEDLDGSVTIESDPGSGTVVRLTLPVTVALSEVLFVKVGDEEFAVPAAVIEGVERAGGSVLEDDDRTGHHRDGEVGVAATDGGAGRSVIDLADALDVPGESTGAIQLRVASDVRPVNLAVDAVGERREVVTTPYKGILDDIPGMSGATIRGDGQLVNVIDVETL